MKTLVEKAKYNSKRRDWYNWQKRANAVGVAPLPARRPTPAQWKSWKNEIETKENEQRKG